MIIGKNCGMNYKMKLTELKSNKSPEICDDCKGSGSDDDRVCSSCNGKGILA